MNTALNRRVLVLANGQGLAKRMTGLLERAGYEVAGPARTVREAKQAVGIDGVDAAVLDVGACSDGPLSFDAEITRQGAPVLLLTGCETPRASGVAGHVSQLEQPFTNDEFLNRVEALFAPNPACRREKFRGA